jgi:hypothetical protein
VKFRVLIVVLLALNLAWLGLIWLNQRDALRPRHVPAATEAVAPVPPSTVTQLVTQVVTNAFEWAQLESEDYRAYITRLRAIGCPEETIRDIVMADLDGLFAGRLAGIRPHRANLQYWHSEEAELANNHDGRDWQRQERAIDKEKREIIRELVGADLVSERLKRQGQEDYYARRLDFLSEDKRMEVRELLETYRERVWDVREKEWEEGASLTAEDRAALRRFREEHEAALARLLTPEERERFDLWLSPTAQQVRNDLYGMEATEQEFLAIYRTRKLFDETWRLEELDLSEPASYWGWVQARGELDRQIQAQLGPQRYADYVRGQDRDYHLLNAAVSRYGLPRSKANQVYEFKRALLAQKEQLLTDTTISAELKPTVLQTLDTEAVRMLREALGERAFNYYQRRAGWLK